MLSPEGAEGETDARGPWNEGGDWQIVEVPELKEGVEKMETLQGEHSRRGKKQRTSSSNFSRRPPAIANETIARLSRNRVFSHLAFKLRTTPMHTQTITAVAHHPTHLR
jgi:hypothetical protein